MLHTGIIPYYEKLFAFKQYHNWSTQEIEDLMPWELDVMTTLLNNYIEYQTLARQQASNEARAR